MNVILMTAYVLVWPVLVAIMMVPIGTAAVRDVRSARRRGKGLV